MTGLRYLESDLDCDNSGYTNLHFAVLNEDLPKLESLVANPKVSINAVDMYDLYTALIYAVRKNINIDQEDIYGMSARNYLEGFAGAELKALFLSI
jgi:hypothetical protein